MPPWSLPRIPSRVQVRWRLSRLLWDHLADASTITSVFFCPIPVKVLLELYADLVKLSMVCNGAIRYMDKYVKIKLIGEGSHGKVYLVKEKPDGDGASKHQQAVRSPSDKVWVMKVVPLPSDPKEREECVREGSTMMKLGHPCIVGIPEDTILNWFVQLVLALEYLHHKNILHRDVKAENVFLRSRHDTPLGNAATVQLGDFGISRMLEAHEAVARSFVGTPLYMSPELIRNEPYDHKSDIWALGCILYEMMCFTKPFPATSIRDLVLRVLKSNYRPPPH
ncbi:unnamed protein product, partial [Closterium sp. Yama58-4]